VYPAAVLRKQLVSATSAAQAAVDGTGLLIVGDDGGRIVGQQIFAAQAIEVHG
jgi:hypothetical protein